MRSFLLLTLLSLAACGGQPTEPPAASRTAAPVVLAADAAAPAPKLDVVLTLLGPGELEVAGSANLASELRVEQDDGADRWKPLVQAQPFLLRATCEKMPASCTQVDGAHAIRAVRWPWSGLETASQCPPAGLGLAGTSAWPETRVRFVASACDGGARAASPVFVAPASNDMPSAERRWAAEAVTAVTAMRLENSTHGWDGAAAADPSRLVGFAVRPGSEHPLDPAARAGLAALLRDPKGYSDIILKRCMMRHLLGFRITRTLPSTGSTLRTQELEIALDLTCNKFFIARGDAAPRAVHASHFDPSHAAYLALVQQIFTTDVELSKVK